MKRIAIIVAVAVIVRALPGNVESGERNGIRLKMIVPPAAARAWYCERLTLPIPGSCLLRMPR